MSLAGALLGAGSFGRVYKGRWNSVDVAVKVIEHDPASASEVENEVLLMMRLPHDNIVAAYHYVTYARSSEAAAAAAAADSCHLSSNGSTSMQGRLPSGTGSQDSAQLRSNSADKTSRKDSNTKRRAESHVVMEFCDRGTLSQAITALLEKHQKQKLQQQQQQQAGCVVLREVLFLLQDVARGLQAIHNEHIVHGDLVSDFAVLDAGNAWGRVVRGLSLGPVVHL
jgi:serine/threonine protein kinase